jgi:hypothetical protein
MCWGTNSICLYLILHLLRKFGKNRIYEFSKKFLMILSQYYENPSIATSYLK